MTKKSNGPMRPDGRRNNRPPKQHQYPPGHSGNPGGRPRAYKSTAEIIKKVGDEERLVRLGGETVSIPLIEAVIRTLYEHGLKDPKGSRRLLEGYDRGAELEKPNERIRVPGPNGETEGRVVEFVLAEDEVAMVEYMRDELGRYHVRDQRGENPNADERRMRDDADGAIYFDLDEEDPDDLARGAAPGQGIPFGFCDAEGDDREPPPTDEEQHDGAAPPTQAGD